MSAGDKLSLTQVMGRRITPQGLLSHPGKAKVLTGVYTTFSTLPLLPSSPSSWTRVSVMTEFLPQDLGTCATSEFQAEDLQASPTLYLLLRVLSLGEASPPAAPAPRVFSPGHLSLSKALLSLLISAVLTILLGCQPREVRHSRCQSPVL